MLAEHTSSASPLHQPQRGGLKEEEAPEEGEEGKEDDEDDEESEESEESDEPVESVESDEPDASDESSDATEDSTGSERVEETVEAPPSLDMRSVGMGGGPTTIGTVKPPDVDWEDEPEESVDVDVSETVVADALAMPGSGGNVPPMVGMLKPPLDVADALEAATHDRIVKVHSVPSGGLQSSGC